MKHLIFSFVLALAFNCYGENKTYIPESFTVYQNDKTESNPNVNVHLVLIWKSTGLLFYCRSYDSEYRNEIQIISLEQNSPSELPSRGEKKICNYELESTDIVITGKNENIEDILNSDTLTENRIIPVTFTPDALDTLTCSNQNGLIDCINSSISTDDGVTLRLPHSESAL